VWAIARVCIFAENSLHFSFVSAGRRCASEIELGRKQPANAAEEIKQAHYGLACALDEELIR
jgi:hypothetical protein